MMYVILMSRFIEFIRGKSDYSEFKEGEIKKIKNGCLLRKKRK